ncbi:hypothetical protein GCM10009037_28010 [Halarchaeum grantii]|uniref:Uncharacterized protein n=1 Tax=Halarchaeum grantii TaxID=1193105 RepID=A0A830FD54_9EURY|nr:hypothetical protein [Halarchaeum grantii]GGL42918.1 hypothetical protein GCM10009037_28010 [Halarchaeum grantii]
MPRQDSRTGRRAFLGTLGAGIGVALAGCGGSGTGADGPYFRDGFEDGTDAWTAVEDGWGRSDEYAHEGNYAASIDADGTTEVIARATLAEPRQPSEFEYAWRETAGSYGGGVRLVNESGDVELAFATDNPQWVVGDANSTTQVAEGVGYETWVRTAASFDWRAGDAEVTFQDASSEASYSGRHSLASVENIAAIELYAYTSENNWMNTSCEMWWDDIVVHR